MIFTLSVCGCTIIRCVEIREIAIFTETDWFSVWLVAKKG